MLRLPATSVGELLAQVPPQASRAGRVTGQERVRLDVEAKALGRALRPQPRLLLGRRRVVGRVDLGQRELARVEAQAAPRRSSSAAGTTRASLHERTVGPRAASAEHDVLAERDTRPELLVIAAALAGHPDRCACVSIERTGARCRRAPPRAPPRKSAGRAPARRQRSPRAAARRDGARYRRMRPPAADLRVPKGGRRTSRTSAPRSAAAPRAQSCGSGSLTSTSPTITSAISASRSSFDAMYVYRLIGRADSL